MEEESELQWMRSLVQNNFTPRISQSGQQAEAQTSPPKSARPLSLPPLRNQDESPRPLTQRSSLDKKNWTEKLRGHEAQAFQSRILLTNAAQLLAHEGEIDEEALKSRLIEAIRSEEKVEEKKRGGPDPKRKLPRKNEGDTSEKKAKSAVHFRLAPKNKTNQRKSSIKAGELMRTELQRIERKVSVHGLKLNSLVKVPNGGSGSSQTAPSAAQSRRRSSFQSDCSDNDGSELDSAAQDMRQKRWDVKKAVGTFRGAGASRQWDLKYSDMSGKKQNADPMALPPGVPEWSPFERKLIRKLADRLTVDDEDGFVEIYDTIPRTTQPDRIELIKFTARRLSGLEA